MYRELPYLDYIFLAAKVEGGLDEYKCFKI